ncbi:MAG: transglutaminase-like domain-containing protein [Chloroherpetonaceae bacterium]|nr:transglutaminase-like domain-containing protein [Chloroherpetonaceae bacterium]
MLFFKNRKLPWPGQEHRALRQTRPDQPAVKLRPFLPGGQSDRPGSAHAERLPTRRLLTGMVATAATSLEVACWEPGDSLLLLILRCILWSGMTFAAFFLGGHLEPRMRATSTQYVLLAGFLLLPYLTEPLWRAQGYGYTLEWALLYGLRNMSVGFLALSHVTRYGLLAGLSSLFLIVFSYALSQASGSSLLVAVYLTLGSLWLIGSARARGAGEAPLPVRPTLFALTAVVGTFVLLSPGFSLTPASLYGWMPGSGGTRQGDPFAWSGVGDGDAEVGATQKTEETGSAETDFMVETRQASLYDAVDEIYGEARPPSEWRRKIAVQAAAIVETKVERRAGVGASGRDFHTLRRRPKPRQVRDNAPPRALLYVRGRAPVHLRMQVYHEFDGQSWKELLPFHTLSPVTAEKDNWMRLTPDTDFAYFGARERHEIRIGLLKTNRLPMPAHVSVFRVGKVNRADFYLWAQPDILRMDVPDLPQGTRIECESAVPYVERLSLSTWDGPFYPRRPQMLQLPSPERTDPAIYALARAWTRGVPPGWEQVRAIERHLRTEYVLDPQAVPPADCEDAIAHFLLRSRRGPDYLFASSAALLLRSLGYPTRLVSGFYVRPESLDRTRGEYPVQPQDLHFWVEVFPDTLPGCMTPWITLEVTPGYTLRAPMPTLLERLQSLLDAARRRAMRFAPWIALILTAGVLCYLYRYLWLDRAATALWRLQRYRAPRHYLAQTVRLLERRARWSGNPRRPGETPGQWFHRFPAADSECDLLARIACILDWTTFAPASLQTCAPFAPDEIYRLCTRAGETWTLRRLRMQSHLETPREVVVCHAQPRFYLEQEKVCSL